MKYHDTTQLADLSRADDATIIVTYMKLARESTRTSSSRPAEPVSRRSPRPYEVLAPRQAQALRP
jgi:hypothetical protein